jgi:transposase InsO family protein
MNEVLKTNPKGNNKSLDELYKDSRYGLTSKIKFIKNLKELDLYKNYTKKEIDNYFKKRKIIDARPTEIREQLQITAFDNQIGQYQCDLMDISKWSKTNSGYKWLLNVIDIYSRKAWSVPLKNKTGKTVTEAIKPILELTKDKKFRSVKTDQGSEFIDRNFRKVCDDLGYRLSHVNPKAINNKSQVGIVERFNKNIVDWMKKFMYYNHTTKFIDDLHKYIERYNNEIHSTTKQKPNNIFDNGYKSKQKIKVIPAMFQIYPIGFKVHHLEKQKLFDKKAFVLNYSARAYPVQAYINPKYKVDGRWFYKDELITGEDFDDYHKNEVIMLQKEIKNIEKKHRIDRRLKQDLGVNRDDTKYKESIKTSKRIRIPVKRLNL